MNLKSLTLSIAFLLVQLNVEAQVFPEIWDYSSYDLLRGQKGALRIINYNGQSTPFDNKAYIVATTILQSGILNDKDLFRLTCRGVSTLNSPFSGYNVKLDFCNQEVYQGSITGGSSVLRMYGKDKLALGTEHRPDIFNLTNDASVFANDVKVDYSAITMHFGLSNAKDCGWIGSMTDTGIELGTNSATAMYINDRICYLGFNQRDAANISAALKTQFNVFVRKGILSSDYAIAPISSWADFVFDKGYRLTPLQEVKTFIDNNHHLPDVPSAEDVADKGYSQHELNKALLQKVEELTLYVIQLEDEIKALKGEAKQK